MRFCYLILIVTFLLNISTPLSANRIGGTIQNVDLIIKNLCNSDNHDCGEEYFVINHNDFPMRVSIRITDQINTDDRLIHNIIIVEPHDKASLGSVLQKDTAKPADWKFQWQTKADK